MSEQKRGVIIDPPIGFMRNGAMKLVGFLLTTIATLLVSASAVAQEDLHTKDFKWLQFNLYQAFDAKIPFDNQNDTFFEMEFGGRSGILDLYGFVDVFDIFDTPQSDLHNEDNLFLKFLPRLSLNEMSKKDLSVAFVKEWYLAGLMLVGNQGLFQEYIGVGTDLEVPWFGKTVANLMARYVRENFGAPNEGRWDGVLLDMAWFKPYYTFANKNFLTYQGYFHYTFGATKISDSPLYSDSSIEWYNGFYWHSPRYAAGYALKYFKDMGLLRSGSAAGETTGFGHYFVVTYKF